MTLENVKIEELIREVNKCHTTEQELKSKVYSLQNEIHTKHSQIFVLKGDLRKLQEENTFLKSEKRSLSVKHSNKIKQLETEIKKKDLFSQTYRGTSKTRKEALFNKEMNELRRINRILCDVIKQIATKLQFDDETIKYICSVADSPTDSVIEALIKNLTESTEDDTDLFSTNPDALEKNIDQFLN